MGVVYKAHEESLNRFVALKVLGEHLSQDPSFVARFEREAQSAASLQHPNVVHIFFIGEDKGRHYFAMEFVKGRSLSSVIAERGRLPADEAVGLLLQAAAGLGAAHDRGLLHRDIKPANIMLTDDGMVKLTDFGLALPMDVATRLTATGALLGTPAYVSPEQCEGLQPDPRSDIYSLGLTFYEMLTGQVPFQADSPMGLLRKILQTEPAPIRDVVPDVDPRLERVLGRMMAKDREQRYGSCREITADLEAYRRGEDVAARPIAPPPPPVPTIGGDPVTEQPTVLLPNDTGVGSAAGATPAAPPPARRSNRTVLAAVAVVVLLLASVAAATVLVLGKQWSSRGTVVPVPLGAVSEVSAESAGDTSPPATQSATNDATSATPGVEVAALETSEPTATGQEPLPAEAGSAGPGAAVESPPTSSSPSPLPSPPTLQSRSTSPSPASGSANRAAPIPSSRPPAREVATRPTAAEPPRRPPLPLQPRVCVVGTGEPLLAVAAEEWLEHDLRQRGVDVVAEDSIPAVSDLLRGPLQVQELLRALERGDIHVLVLAEADFVGERTLTYLNRYDRALTSRLRVNAYLTGGSGAIYPGWSEELEYTEINAGRKAESALLPAMNDLVDQINRGWEAFRRQR